MTQEQKQYLGYAAVVIAVLVAGLLGVRYPLPEPPTVQTMTEGDSNFTNVVASGDITAGDDLTVGDTLDVNGDIDYNGDGFDVDTTGAISLDADSASNFSTSSGDITIDGEASSVLIIGSEAAADAIELDANDTVTSGIDIDVGSVNGITLDGGLFDIGGGTCGVADGDGDVCIDDVLEVDGELEADGNIDADADLDVDGTANLDDVDIDLSASLNIDGHMVDIGTGSYDTADADNDLGVAGDLEVDGELELDGALDADSTSNFAGTMTLQGLLLTSFADETITDGETLTPTVTSYNLDSAGNVTMTLAASATEGQLLILCGDDANDITISDTNIRTNDGGAQVLNAYDCLIMVYMDNEWIELSNSDNS